MMKSPNTLLVGENATIIQALGHLDATAEAVHQGVKARTRKAGRLPRRAGEKPFPATPDFSFIVPSKGRPGRLLEFLESVFATTARPEALEIILVVDEDDLETQAAVPDRPGLRMVRVRPGLAMGALNMAGYAVSTGRFIMLLNDDVLLRTKGWDDEVRAVIAGYPDEFILVHVNDMLFKEKLCTFPMVSRKYTELAGGICPEHYLRYRIDDHVYNVFNMLGVMGRNRILFLPHVVFEHHNYEVGEDGEHEYRPDEAIIAIDIETFDNSLDERKELALRIMERIDERTSPARTEQRRKLLGVVRDSYCIRSMHYVRVISDQGPSSPADRVTIGVVTADMTCAHAQECLERIRKYTQNYELVLLNNNFDSNFNHAREMNRILDMARTDYVVLLDDDALVEPGWLDALLRCMTGKAGVAVPMHKNREGLLSYAGICMTPDYSGHHTHSYEVFDRPYASMSLCSAAMLIDRNKCGHLRLNESYHKYFLDIDYGFQIWEAGFEVVCAPQASVIHLGGATFAQDSEASTKSFEIQRAHFWQEWSATGRWKRLEEAAFRQHPDLRPIFELGDLIEAQLASPPTEEPWAYYRRMAPLLSRLVYYPAVKTHFIHKILTALDFVPLDPSDPERGWAAMLLGLCGQPTIIDKDYHGFKIVLCHQFFVMERASLGLRFDLANAGRLGKLHCCDTLEEARAWARDPKPGQGIFLGDTALSKIEPIPLLVVEGYKSFNIILYGFMFFAIRQGDGGFGLARFMDQGYKEQFSGESVEDVMAAIDARNCG